MKNLLKGLWIILTDVFWLLFKMSVFLFIIGSFMWVATGHDTLAAVIGWIITGLLAICFLLMSLFYLDSVFTKVEQNNKKGNKS